MKRNASLTSNVFRPLQGRMLGSWLVSLIMLSPSAYSQPVGGNISAGAGTISQSGTNTTITQQSQNLAINWQGFSIASNEAVHFNQPNVSSIALNRVLGQDPSAILGSLTANGQVFILNPNGVLFGITSQVSVGGLAASSLNLSDEDFIAGNYQFNNVSSAGAVINRGNLSASNGGYIALLAPEVRNEGTITATLGTVLLAAGNRVTLNLNNGSLISYGIEQGSLNALAENKQLIRADGGQVILTARAADALSSAVVNNTGVIEARTIQNIGGVIKLMGDLQIGQVHVEGRLDASAPVGGDGGFIETSAAHVNIANNAQITTAAPAGLNGTWLIDPVDFTIAVSGGDITGATLSANLGAGNVTILSSSGGAGAAGNVNVNDVVSWSANKLTLNAQNNININASMNGSGTASLALEYGQGAVAAGNTGNYYVNAAVNLPAGANFSTKLGSDGTVKNYTVITSLGAAGSTTATDLQGISGNLAGNYVLGANIDATATSAWNAGAGFAPIGSGTGSGTATQFRGVFDGLGHTISNLVVNRPGSNFVGMFGATGTTFVVRNLGLAGGSVSGLDFVGGLVGYNNGLIYNSYNTGNVSGGINGNVGGLVGRLNNNATAIINNSYATGTVTSSGGANSYAGGLVGVTSFSSRINNSYATGAVSGANFSGGLVGNHGGSFLTNSFSTGSVSGTTAGGLLGTGFGGVTNCFWDTQTSFQSTSPKGTGMTTADMMTLANFTSATTANGNINPGWDFANTWFIVDGATRPFLRSEYSTTISNAHQLQLMAMNLGASYTLGANINLAESALASGMWKTTTGFAPIGSLATPFTGNFDGLSYSISNLSINRPATDYVGLFGYISAATVTNANVSGSVTGNNYVGGIAGKTNNFSTLSSSSFTGSVTGNSFVGGAVGWNDPSTISNVFVNGSVSGINSVGGIVGWNDGSTIDIASFSGSVTGTDNVGGLAGENTGVSNISNVIVAGNVNGTANATNLGGVIGANTSTGSVSASYWDIQGTGRTNAVGIGSGTGTTGLTSAEMSQQASFAGLDFVNTWRIYEGHTAPLLAGFLTPLTITVNNASKTYDGLAYTGGNGYTTSLTPDASLLGSLVYAGSSQGAVNAGSYTISAGGFYSNQQGYDITVVNGQLTVNPLSLIGSITGGGSTYGGALNAGAVSFSNVVGSDNVTPDVVTVSTAGMSASSSGNWRAGTYIGAQTAGTTLGGADAGNYTFAGATADYTIGQLVLTGISISAVNTTYGTGASSGQASFSNLIAGDIISAPVLINANLSTDVSSSGHLKAGSYDQSVMSLLPGIGNDSANYLLASPYTTATANYTVNPLALIGSITGGGSTYGGALNAGTVSFGNVVGNDNVTPDVVSVSTTGMTANSSGNWNAGTYIGAQTVGSTLGGADAGNYTFVGASADYTIGQKALDITADNAAKTYGSTQTWLGTEFTSNGLVNGETIASVTLASAGDTATAGVSGSPYAITASNATGGSFNPGNYTISYVDGALTINPAALNVTANNASKTYDGLGYSGGNGVSYSGFVNGETFAVLGGALAYGGTSQGATDVGSYVISAGGLTSGNYTIGYVNGILTVNPAPMAASSTPAQAAQAYIGLEAYQSAVETVSEIPAEIAMVNSDNAMPVFQPKVAMSGESMMSSAGLVMLLDGGVRLPEELIGSDR